MRKLHDHGAAAARPQWSRKCLGLALAVGFAGVPVIALVPAAAASPPVCSVRDVTPMHLATYLGAGALQSAVNAATAGDTLTVSGTCMGDTTITKNLTVTGSGTLDGTGSAGSVVSVTDGVVATIGGLDITGGTGNYDVGGYAPTTFGGGIDNAGTLTLANTSVSHNTAGDGGGIFNDVGAKLALGGRSGTSVNTNTATGFGGGGIYNYKGTVTSTNATVSGNTASGGSVIGGGGIFNHDGTVWLGSRTTSGTSVNANTAPAGGGIYNYDIASRLTLDNAQVNRNAVTGLGGGILNASALTATLIDTSVSLNRAASGGGVYNSGTLALRNAEADGNAATVYGGGIFNDLGGVLSVVDTTVHANTAGNVGAGIASNGVAKLTDSVVSANVSKTGGGGIYSHDTSLTLNDSSVARNTAPLGGGIYAWGGGTVTLHPFSTVDRNTATTVHGGGGIYYYGGTTLSGVKPGVNVKYNTHGNVVA